MFQKLASLLIAGVTATSLLAGSAHAETVTYDLTFNSGGSSIGSAVLTLNLDPANLTGPFTINSNSNTADFTSLTGTFGSNTFNVTPANFPGLFLGGATDGITLTNGEVTSILNPFGGGGIFAGGNFLFFTGGNNPSNNALGLDFELGATFGTVTVSDPVVAAVPETSTWAMLLLGFACVGFAGYRRKTKRHVTFANA